MKKLILIIIISLSCPLFSEQIHFRLANNQDKYEFIKNSEFYFDTENDNIMFARDWMFSKASVDLMYFENLHRIYITDVELFDQNDNFPDSIKNSIWTLKYYFDDVKSNKNSLFKNEPFWKETWDSISVNDYDEQGKDYFEPLLVKIFDICICIDPVLHNRSNIIFKSVEKNNVAYLITGYNVDKSSKYFYPFLSDYFPYKSQVQYKIVPDGDYLYFYQDGILKLTLVRTNEEMQKEITLYYRNGKCDQSKISWPRHADGTCDYEDVSSVKTVSTPSPSVSKNKTMLVSENLKLRSGEATTSDVITVMSAGTKVKILELGKAENIDGINSNWVKVEVQAGAKDRDGNTISKDTVGWCYGGYLAETTEANNFESTDTKEISDIKIEEAPKQEINIGIVCAIIGAVLLLLLLILIFTVRKKKDNP